MADPEIHSDIFKFVALRPPLQVDKQKKNRRFIFDPRAPGDSVILTELARTAATGAGADRLAGVVGPMVKALGFTPNYPGDGGDTTVDAVVEAIEPHLGNFDAAKLSQDIEAALKQKPDDYVKTEPFTKLRSGLWDRLYVFYFLNRAEPHNLDTLVQGLRVVHLLEYVARQPIQSLGELKIVYNSVPVLGNSVLPSRAATPPDSTASPAPAKPSERDDLLNHFLQVNAALDELHAVPLTVSDAFTKDTRPDCGPARDNVARPQSLPAPPKLNAWVLNSTAIHNLSAATKDALQRASVSPAVAPLPYMVQQLQDRQAFLASRIFGDGALPTADRLTGEALAIPGVQPLVKTSALMKGPVGLVLPGANGLLPGVLPGVTEQLVFPAPGQIRPLGIGDLKVVKQKLRKYAAGEVAHIENVLKGETKDRKHRRLQRTEETVLTEQETSEETEKDTQSTDRFELKRESEKTIQSDVSLQAGVTVSASYGPVQISAQANFATKSSSTESTRNSTNFAKSVTERSLSRVQKRVREERVRKTLLEIEETNDHGLNNANGGDNIAGIYRWVDKYYEAQVYNYGKRLMFEFIVPEPAAFYIYSQNNKPPAGEMPKKPIDLGGLTHKDIQPWNYQLYVSRYQVSNVSPPPPAQKVVSTAFDQPSGGGKAVFTKSSKEITVPDGYTASACFVMWASWVYDNDYLEIIVGENDYVNDVGYRNMNGEDGVIPIGLLAGNYEAYAVAVEVFCARTPEKFEAWQLQTFGSIVAAYQAQLANYQDLINSQSASQGIVISGKNPAENRAIEKEELKKACLTVLTNQDFSAFRGLLGSAGAFGYPEIDVPEARSEGKYIQFFEQAFEWEQLTYLFYPYFWGRKGHWVIAESLADTDPLFTKFLQAGAARVLIPVQPAYESAVLHYLESNGEIWNGGEPPVLNDDLFISVVDELKSQQDADGDAVPDGSPWEVVVPTELVYLQKDSTLPVWP